MKAATKKKPGVRARAAAKGSIRGTVTAVYQNAILEAAERVFGREGFEAAKMADIAREAGVAAGTLYNYFDSKVEIFRSLVQFLGEGMLAEARKVLETPCTSVEQLTALVRASFAFIEQHRAVFDLFKQVAAGEDAAAGRICGPDAIALHDRYADLLTQAISDAQRAKLVRKDITAAELGVVLDGIMHGYVHRWSRHGGSARLTDAAPRIAEIFLEGARRS